MHISTFVVLCDIQMQLTSIHLHSRSVNGFSQVLFGWNIFKSFPLETTRPGFIANHHFETVTFCLQMNSKFVAETNVYITLKS